MVTRARPNHDLLEWGRQTSRPSTVGQTTSVRERVDPGHPDPWSPVLGPTTIDWRGVDERRGRVQSV